MYSLPCLANSYPTEGASFICNVGTNVPATYHSLKDCNLLLECRVFKKHTQIKFCTVRKEGSANRNEWHVDRQMQL